MLAHSTIFFTQFLGNSAIFKCLIHRVQRPHIQGRPEVTTVSWTSIVWPLLNLERQED